MNCKPGELAILIHSVMGENVGKIVQCVELLPNALVLFPEGVRKMPAWRIKERLSTWCYDPRGGLAPDAWLRPIRDNDGEDETLTWAGKPSEIKTPETT